MFSEIFFTFLITSVIGLILKVASYCYKSKCKKVNLCCLTIIRDIDNEERLDEIELNKIQKVKSNNNLTNEEKI